MPNTMNFYLNQNSRRVAWSASYILSPPWEPNPSYLLPFQFKEYVGFFPGASLSREKTWIG